MSVYAKSKGKVELRDHLIAVRDTAQLLLTPARRAAFARLGIGEAEAGDLLLSAAWLHDFGKAETKWQEIIRQWIEFEEELEKRKSAGLEPPKKPPSTPQHSLTSFLACRWVFDKGMEAMPPNQLAVSLAILAHHGQLHRESYPKERYAHHIHPLAEHWHQLAAELPLKLPEKRIPAEFEARKICTLVEEATRRVPDLARQSTFRGLYCLLLSLLVESDQAASGGYNPHPPLVQPPHIPGTKTTFQNDAIAHAAQTLCALAGCGSGKTAMALSRAAHLAHEHHVDRIVLCLPTRFTSNSLLRDMNNPELYRYSFNDVGLVHSEALMVLQAQMADSDEDSFPDSPEERPDTAAGRASKAVRYEHAVTISTVDHLLMSLYHGYKFSDRAFGNLLSTLVVFDEVHAYDTTTLNAIREGQNILACYGIPAVFMSATLPSSRRRFFNLGEAQTLIESDNPFKPLRLEKLQEPLTMGKGVCLEATPTAREALRDARNLKLAVYVNQVERAKALTRAAKQELPETPIFCYHSELAPQDRRDVEAAVLEAFEKDEPVVLIATQAAELSLNISAERMVAELANADTLVQRAGRLHRRGALPVQETATDRLPAGFEFRLQIAPLDLTPHPKKPDLIPGALPYTDIEALNLSWDNAPWGEDFDFQKGLDWCEVALPNEPENKLSSIRKAHMEDTVFGRRPQENFNGQDNPDGVVIRDIDESPVLVVPEDYYNKGLPGERQLLAQWQVPVRRSRFRLIPKHLLFDTSTSLKVRRRWNQVDEIAFPIIVVRREVPYDGHQGGFDFTSLSDVEEEDVGIAML